jgi:hypothetical protein
MRNLNKPPRYNVASIQAQQTLGGDVMQSDENGNYVEWRDYQWLLTEKQRLDAEVERLRIAGSESEPRFVLLSDYRHLKAQVERLQSIHSIDSIGIEQLKAQVERLTKAGDLLCRMAGNNQVINRHWKTAKKGVQS